jgi:hypothetical protein
MLQFLPAIASLLESNKKQADQAKQNQINAYMGQAPSAQPQGQGGGGILQGLGGLLGGLGGAKKKPHTPGDGGPNADGITGPNGGKLMTENEVYGPGAGAGSYDLAPPAPEDEIL